MYLFLSRRNEGQMDEAMVVMKERKRSKKWDVMEAQKTKPKAAFTGPRARKRKREREKAKLLRIPVPHQTTVSDDGQATQVQTGTENGVSIHMGFDEN